MQLIKGVDVGCCELTVTARAVTRLKNSDAVPFWCVFLNPYEVWLIHRSAETAHPVFQKQPDSLAATGYAVPIYNMAGPFQYGHDTKSPVWEWRKERIRLKEAGNNHMAGYSGRAS
jgi:hypothetical protein